MLSETSMQMSVGGKIAGEVTSNAADLVFNGEVDKIGINQNLVRGAELTVVLEKQSS